MQMEGAIKGEWTSARTLWSEQKRPNQNTLATMSNQNTLATMSSTLREFVPINAARAAAIARPSSVPAPNSTSPFFHFSHHTRAGTASAAGGHAAVQTSPPVLPSVGRSPPILPLVGRPPPVLPLVGRSPPVLPLVGRQQVCQQGSGASLNLDLRAEIRSPGSAVQLRRQRKESSSGANCGQSGQQPPKANSGTTSPCGEGRTYKRE